MIAWQMLFAIYLDKNATLYYVLCFRKELNARRHIYPRREKCAVLAFCYCSESLNIDRCSSNACIRKNIWQYLFDEVISMSKIKPRRGFCEWRL